MIKILLVEDDPRTVAFVRRGLEAEGFVVDVAENGRDGLALARAFNYPLIVLDRMLPMIDGLDVCHTLRREGCASLLLMLTAKDTLQDKVDGLHGGADDYLTKPFAFEELLVRMEALLRRGGYRETPRVLRVGDLTLDEATRKVVRGGREVSLTVREFALLSYLMAYAGTVVSRARLLSNVWNYSFDPGTKVVDVYVRYLRKKIDEGEERPLIHTVRGFGYRLSAEEHSTTVGQP
jgi:two-component system, OmpR family, response regulator